MSRQQTISKTNKDVKILEGECYGGKIIRERKHIGMKDAI